MILYCSSEQFLTQVINKGHIYFITYWCIIEVKFSCTYQKLLLIWVIPHHWCKLCCYHLRCHFSKKTKEQNWLFTENQKHSVSYPFCVTSSPKRLTDFHSYSSSPIMYTQNLALDPPEMVLTLLHYSHHQWRKHLSDSQEGTETHVTCILHK